MNNKEILIIGGTGTLGQEIAKQLCENYNPKGIRIFSRDEFKQWKMKNNFTADTPISYLLGDVRDYRRLDRALYNVDIVFDCAAMKQVPTCEYNPIEAIKTNIDGARNILDLSIDNKVEKVMHVSTDKACLPINLYGMTKAVAEKLFIHGNVYVGNQQTKFSCVRYGNVLGSRGSIIPLFKEQAEKNGEITITDARMTRFWIPIKKVAKFIIDRTIEMEGEETFVPKMPSAKIVDLAKTVCPDAVFKNIGIRQGEKLHECLITEEESLLTIAHDDFFTIHPTKHEIKDPLAKPWAYDSKSNPWRLYSAEILRDFLGDLI